MRKFVKVTLLTTLLSESGEQKIQAHSNPSISKKDQYGYTIEDWEDMKVDIPEDSIHLTEGVEDDKIEDTDLDIVPSQTFFDADDFLMVTEHLDFGSTIYLRTGHTLDVLETPRTVINRINKLNK